MSCKTGVCSRTARRREIHVFWSPKVFSFSFPARSPRPAPPWGFFSRVLSSLHRQTIDLGYLFSTVELQTIVSFPQFPNQATYPRFRFNHSYICSTPLIFNWWQINHEFFPPSFPSRMVIKKKTMKGKKSFCPTVQAWRGNGSFVALSLSYPLQTLFILFS